jgi:hypothetical protein
MDVVIVVKCPFAEAPAMGKYELKVKSPQAHFTLCRKARVFNHRADDTLSFD